MNILVYDVAASESGALNVLKDFYKEVNESKIQGVNWYFIVSTPEFVTTDKITVLRFPHIKKGWIHRVKFELFEIQKLLKQHKIDYILSLQNIKIMRTKVPQTVYMHNIIPFTEYKFKFSKNKLLWIYQNLIAKLIFYSMKKANHVIVQADWIRKICIKKLHIAEKKIAVVSPSVYIENPLQYKYDDRTRACFFYPAMAFEYKNHSLIIEACNLLSQKGITNYEVIFTLDENENQLTKILFYDVQEKHLPINFVGKLPREEVLDFYSRSVLLFPSKVESSPLPLSEARLCQTFILAANYSYAKERLNNYENAYYFDADNANALAILMEKSIYGHFELSDNKLTETENATILESLIKQIGEDC